MSQWIKIEDKLPQSYTLALVAFKIDGSSKLERFVAYTDDDGEWTIINWARLIKKTNNTLTPVYWIEIPEFPGDQVMSEDKENEKEIMSDDKGQLFNELCIFAGEIMTKALILHELLMNEQYEIALEETGALRLRALTITRKIYAQSNL